MRFHSGEKRKTAFAQAAPQTGFSLLLTIFTDEIFASREYIHIPPGLQPQVFVRLGQRADHAYIPPRVQGQVASGGKHAAGVCYLGVFRFFLSLGIENGIFAKGCVKRRMKQFFRRKFTLGGLALRFVSVLRGSGYDVAPFGGKGQVFFCRHLAAG